MPLYARMAVSSRNWFSSQPLPKAKTLTNRPMAEATFQPPLLFHDEELGDTGDEQGQGHGGHGQLARIQQPLFLQVVEPGCAVIAAEKAEDEGHRQPPWAGPWPP